MTIRAVTIRRIPVCQVNGVITYREVDLRAGGDDPLMTWLRDAADWEITDMEWNEKTDQPSKVTWCGDVLWDETTNGEVRLDVQDCGTAAALISVGALFRVPFTGIVTIGGVVWDARGVRAAAPPTGFPVDNMAVGSPMSLAADNTAVSFAPGLVPTDPYRTATPPTPVAAKTVVTARCTGVIDTAFKASIEGSIRRVYTLLTQLNRRRGAT